MIIEEVIHVPVIEEERGKYYNKGKGIKPLDDPEYVKKYVETYKSNITSKQYLEFLKATDEK